MMFQRGMIPALIVGILLGCSSSSSGDSESNATDNAEATDGIDGVAASTGADGADGMNASDGTTAPDTCAKAAPDGAPCNPYCQTGCSEGQSCTWSGSAFACASPGTSPLDTECNNTSCAEGLACFGIQSDGGTSKCRQFCISDTDCPTGRRCSLSVSFPGGVSATFCSEVEVGCNVFDDPSTCPDGQACYLTNGVTKCLPSGTLEAGTACSNQPAGSCAPGLQCLIECTAVCSTNGSNSPSCDSTCDISQPVNETNGIGFCIGDTPPQECDLFAQTGCEDGKSCFPGIEGWKCLTSAGVKAGEVCEFTNDCEPGAACLGSQCQTLCSTKADAPDDIACEALCETAGNLNPTGWGVGYCSDAEPAVPCDYWKQDCQEAGTACYFVNNGATCLPVQVEGKLGDSCNSLTECGKSLLCISGACSEVCSIDEFAPPPAPICVDVCPGGNFSPYGSFENQIGVCD